MTHQGQHLSAISPLVKSFPLVGRGRDLGLTTLVLFLSLITYLLTL